MKAMKLVLIIFMSTGILTGCSFASDAEQENSLTYEERIIVKDAIASQQQPLDLGNLEIQVDTIDLVSIEVEKIEAKSLFPSNH